MWSPISAGDARPSHHTFTTDSGVFSLVGVVASSIAMHTLTPNGVERTCTGSWVVTDTVNGKADFYPSSADVATPGQYFVYPVVTLNTGPVAMDKQTLIINNTP